MTIKINDIVYVTDPCLIDDIYGGYEFSLEPGIYNVKSSEKEISILKKGETPNWERAGTIGVSSGCVGLFTTESDKDHGLCLQVNQNFVECFVSGNTGVKISTLQYP